MARRSSQAIRNLYGKIEVREISNLLGISRSCSNITSNGRFYMHNNVDSFITKNSRCWSCSTYLYRGHFMHPWPNTCSHRSMSSSVNKNSSGLPWTSGDKYIFQTKVAPKFPHLDYVRLVTTQAKAPPQVRRMGALKVSMLSPGFVYEPYAPREKFPFWKRWFTRSGWRRTKEDIIMELKSAYAIAKLRKSGYSKQKFYGEAVNLYKEISTHMANGEKTSLRKLVTEKMYSIGVDRDDLSKVFVQLTIEFLTKQKFEAYDSSGAVIAGDKDKEVLVREIWVFEKSLFHPGAYWRLCGRINT